MSSMVTAATTVAKDERSNMDDSDPKRPVPELCPISREGCSLVTCGACPLCHQFLTAKEELSRSFVAAKNELNQHYRSIRKFFYLRFRATMKYETSQFEMDMENFAYHYLDARKDRVGNYWNINFQTFEEIKQEIMNYFNNTVETVSFTLNDVRDGALTRFEAQKERRDRYYTYAMKRTLKRYRKQMIVAIKCYKSDGAVIANCLRFKKARASIVKTEPVIEVKTISFRVCKVNETKKGNETICFQKDYDNETSNIRKGKDSVTGSIQNFKDDEMNPFLMANIKICTDNETNSFPMDTFKEYTDSVTSGNGNEINPFLMDSIKMSTDNATNSFMKNIFKTCKDNATYSFPMDTFYSHTVDDTNGFQKEANNETNGDQKDKYNGTSSFQKYADTHFEKNKDNEIGSILFDNGSETGNFNSNESSSIQIYKDIRVGNLKKDKDDETNNIQKDKDIETGTDNDSQKDKDNEPNNIQNVKDIETGSFQKDKDHGNSIQKYKGNKTSNVQDYTDDEINQVLKSEFSEAIQFLEAIKEDAIAIQNYRNKQANHFLFAENRVARVHLTNQKLEEGRFKAYQEERCRRVMLNEIDRAYLRFLSLFQNGHPNFKVLESRLSKKINEQHERMIVDCLF